MLHHESGWQSFKPTCFEWLHRQALCGNSNSASSKPAAGLNPIPFPFYLLCCKPLSTVYLGQVRWACICLLGMPVPNGEPRNLNGSGCCCTVMPQASDGELWRCQQSKLHRCVKQEGPYLSQHTSRQSSPTLSCLHARLSAKRLGCISCKTRR